MSNYGFGVCQKQRLRPLREQKPYFDFAYDLAITVSAVLAVRQLLAYHTGLHAEILAFGPDIKMNLRHLNITIALGENER